MASPTKTIDPDDPVLRKSVEARPVRPVMFFAAMGCLFLAVQAYAWIMWAASGQMKPAEKGPTPIPDWMEITARVTEITNFLGGLAVLYWFLVRPWRRDGRPSLDGMLVVIWVQMWLLHDPIQNWTQNNFSYNATFVNLGSWTSSLPGWVAPNSHEMGEPLLWGLGAYAVGMFMPMLACCWAMRKVQNRFPNIGVGGLVAFAVISLTLFLFVLETIWVRTGQYSYLAVVEELSFFDGNYYQYPMLYSSIGWGLLWGGMASLRYFLNDKGQTVAERGIESVKTTSKRKTGLRFLALLGLCNIMYTCFYDIPMNVMGAHVDPTPRDVYERSYLTSGLCGIGTDRACPGSALPIIREDSAYFTPEGMLVLPDGGLPVQVPADK